MPLKFHIRQVCVQCKYDLSIQKPGCKKSWAIVLTFIQKTERTVDGGMHLFIKR